MENILQDQLGVYKPKIREHIAELLNPEVSYVSKSSLELERTADAAPWEPSENTKSYLEESEIETINESTNLKQICDIFRMEGHVGLVLMGHIIDRYSKPALIVLTTKYKFFVVEPNDLEIGIKFTKAQLNDPCITFWISEGVREAECLYHIYGIDLRQYRVKCCTGLHLQLMKTLARFPPDAFQDSSFYPQRALQHSKRNLRSMKNLKLERYETLVDLWLNIHKRDLLFASNQMPHLNVRPLNLTATNLIRKRCSHVVRLGKMLAWYCRLELQAMNDNIMNSLVLHEYKAIRKLVRKLYSEYEGKKVANCEYFIHLDGCLAKKHNCRL